MYLDQIYKIEYYKSMIASQLAKKGSYPDAEAISSRLSSLDTKLAVFRYTCRTAGESFDAAKFNNEMESVCTDLKILYRLAYELAVTRYRKIKTFVEAGLRELESLADKYEKKMNFETGATSIGKTVYFRTNAFPVSGSFNNFTVDMGQLEVSRGSRLLAFITGRNFEDSDVVFRYGENEICSPYSLARDYFEVPGRRSKKCYAAKTADDIAHTSMFQVQSDDLVPDRNNDYIIYAGKNTVGVKDTAGLSVYVQEQSPGSFSLSQEKGRVTFFVKNAGYISLDCSSEPAAKNFSGYLIDSPKESQKITFEFQGPFHFNVVTDGTIYAARKKGILYEEKLYYPDADDLHDFVIEEYSFGDSVTISPVTAVIKNPAATPEIEMIAVKEVTLMDEVDADD